MTKKASDMKKEINEFNKFVLDFIEMIGIKDKISMVGDLLGGYVVSQVAIDNKERIEKLVLIDSSGLLEKPTLLLEQVSRCCNGNRVNTKIQQTEEY